MADREWSPSTEPLPITGRTPPRYYLAHWWPRVLATFVDSLILVPAYVVLVFGFHLVTITHELNANGTSVPQVHTSGVLLLALVPVLYAVLLLCRSGERNGQTWGKQVAGLRVIRNDGEPVDLRTALVREGLVKALPGMVGFYSGLSGLSSLFSLLDDLWPLGDKENRAIHDHVAKTHVVQTHKRPAYTPDPVVAPPNPVASPNPVVAPPVSAPSAGEALMTSDASSTPLREVPIGANVYVALRDIAPDTVGACWINPAASVRADSDNVHVVRVSHAPEGLFVSVSAAYESLLASNPSEAARHERAGWRRAALSFS
jgi:uncharacterized RDD family membrane protein YckC